MKYSICSGIIFILLASSNVIYVTSKFSNDFKDIDISDWQPQQIHIAYGKSIDEMTISWLTPSQTDLSIIQYGAKSMNMTATAFPTKFVDGGSEHRMMWMHHVQLKGLLPDTRYFYHCGSILGWSGIYTFITMKNGTDWPVRVALYGDMGAVNPQSLSRLQLETQQGMYDAIIHVGDFAYNMDTDNARVGDEFMRQVEPIAAYVPYMTCPGNHEEAYNFSNYRARFNMPNYEDSESYFYSWNMGPVHFIAVNTEAYYFVEYGLKPLSRQYHWLIDDLEEATTPENREARPWIVMFGHRPMYCSNEDKDDCTRINCLTRVGLPVIKTYGMEELLDKYGVDLAVWAHEHSYERLWPIYNYTVYNGTEEEPYTNPKAPVHFTTGSAGCEEHHDDFLFAQPDWSAVRSIDYGYTKMNVVNKTHLHLQQVSDDQNGAIIDDIWLIRDKHVSYRELRNPQPQ